MSAERTAEAIGSTLAAVVAVSIVGAFMAAAYILSGFVLEHLWNWFAPPFTDIRMTTPMAVGTSVLVSAIKGLKYTPNTDKKDTAHRLAFIFYGPGILLLVGFVAHSFMGAA